MPRMRTIDTAIRELRQEDPACALTKNALRQMVISRRIPAVMAGCKYLVNLDALQTYLENPLPQEQEPERGKIRRIG